MLVSTDRAVLWFLELEAAVRKRTKSVVQHGMETTGGPGTHRLLLLLIWLKRGATAHPPAPSHSPAHCACVA